MLEPGKNREGGSSAGCHVLTSAVSQIIGEGVEALPECGKEAWGDGDTGKDTSE